MGLIGDPPTKKKTKNKEEGLISIRKAEIKSCLLECVPTRQSAISVQRSVHIPTKEER